MQKTEAETILAEAGLNDNAIAATLAGIHNLHGKFACRSPRELWIEDTVTGALRFPEEADAYYRKRFARAGLVLVSIHAHSGANVPFGRDSPRMGYMSAVLRTRSAGVGILSIPIKS